MIQHHERPAWFKTCVRTARLSVVTGFMTFAIAVAAEAFSPPVEAAIAHPFFAAEECATALTVGLATTRNGNSGYWLKLVNSYGATACAIR